MKASAIFAALKTLIEAGQPVFVWGGPGLGKSSIVRKLAAVRETLLQDIRALLLDPVDLRGLPFPWRRRPRQMGDAGNPPHRRSDQRAV